MPQSGIRHPFFQRRWRRVTCVLATGGWAVLEAALGNLIWCAVFAGISAYCFWEFFIIFDPRDYASDGDETPPE